MEKTVTVSLVAPWTESELFKDDGIQQRFRIFIDGSEK